MREKKWKLLNKPSKQAVELHNLIFLLSFSRYLYIYYLPSGLFVIVSWVSFLIPPEVVPGRMALLVTLFLVLVNIFNTINNISPNVEGMTAISMWMIACIFFVFGSLMAYATLLYFLSVSQIGGISIRLLNWGPWKPKKEIAVI